MLKCEITQNRNRFTERCNVMGIIILVEDAQVVDASGPAQAILRGDALVPTFDHRHP